MFTIIEFLQTYTSSVIQGDPLPIDSFTLLMIGIALCIIGLAFFAILFFLRCAIKHKDLSFIDNHLFLLSFLAIFLAYSIVLYPSIHSTATPDNEEYRITQSIPIASLKLSSPTISGSFFLGTGEINSRTYYKFYRQLDNGNLQFERIDAVSVQIKRSDTEAPSLVTYSKIHHYTTPWKAKLKGTEENAGAQYKVLIIPTNSIEVKYDANL